MASASPSNSVSSVSPRTCGICRAFLCKWQEHEVCVLHYTSACIRGGSCVVCRDWSEEMWIMSDAQRDKRLAKLEKNRSSKKAKVSVKGTPSRKLAKPSKTVIVQA